MDNILEAMKIVSSLNETSLANSSRRPCLMRDLYVFRLKISNLSESADVPPPIDCDEEDSDDTDELGTNAGLLRFGNSFYAFLTPFILIIGLIGNSMSLKVFTSRVMRRLSSSIYLMALSVSDMLVLLTYVLLDWLNDGLKYWPGGYRLPLKNYNGACQAFMYASYMFRFMSAWFIVIFAVERYLAVCWPVHRKRLCTKRMAKRLILIVFFTAAVLCLYKPMLSQVYNKGTAQICTRNEHFNKLIFWLDTIYAFFITAVPSLAIIVLNLPILKRLIDCKKHFLQHLSVN